MCSLHEYPYSGKKFFFTSNIRHPMRIIVLYYFLDLSRRHDYWQSGLDRSAFVIHPPLSVPVILSMNVLFHYGTFKIVYFQFRFYAYISYSDCSLLLFAATRKSASIRVKYSRDSFIHLQKYLKCNQ